MKHYVYDTKEEAGDDKGDIKYWKDNPQEGDWVEADDGGIVQILKRGDIKHPNDRRNYKANKCYVRTVVGTFLLNDKSYMDTDFSQHKNRYTFSKTLKNANENFKKRKNITKQERLFATQVIVGKDAVAAVQNVYGEQDFSKARKKALMLLKQERVIKEVEKGALDVAKALGIDHEYVLRRLKMLADDGEDDNIILQSTKELAKIIGTTGQTTKQKEVGVVGLFQGFSPEQLNKADRAHEHVEVVEDDAG